MNQKFPSTNIKNEIELSKKLSWILRHGAEKEGLTIQPNGFINVDSILKHPKYAAYFTQKILEQLVANDKKQRFMLRRNPNDNSFEIRANQGHSIETVKSEQCLGEIQNPNSIPMAVHGTYFRFWERIKTEGLRRMTRNHIHFATFDKNIENKIAKNNKDAISGFRNDCQILIYLNVPKLIENGKTKLYRSSNGVILCAGINENGVIPKEYFEKVIERRTGKMLEY